MLEQVPDRQLGTRLVRHERAVDGREPEAREVIRGVARGIEVEDELHLLAEAMQRELAHPVHHLLDLALAGVGALRGHHDEDAQEVRMAVERGRHRVEHRTQMLPR